MPVVINGTTGISPVSAAGTSASIDGMTVGRGGGEVSTNTAVGTSALAANTTGAQHTAVGYQALTAQASATSAGSTAVGYQAGLNYNNADAVGSSTFVGFWAGKTTSTGTDNTFVGGSAGQLNTTGGYNATLGGASLQVNTTGSYNTAIGMQALRNNTTASNNTAVGYQCLYNNSTANENTAVGSLSLYSNTTGNLHVAVGREALYSNTTGIYNTAVGWNALYSNTTGGSNVAVGMRAGNTGTNNLTTGSNNTFIGYYTASASASGTYQVVIGSEVASQNSGGYVTIGDYSAKIYCYYRGGATWTQVSDATMKNVIGPDTLGLSFIKRLKPVTFTWKDVGDLPKNHPRYDARGGGDSTTVVHGLIAQEVKEALDAEGCTTFNGWDEGPDGIQAISRDMFITPLIKAIQEQQAIIDQLTSRIAALEAKGQA